MSAISIIAPHLTGGPFDERHELRAVEDYLLWLQLNRRTAFHYLPEPLLYKRMHAASISADCALQLQRIHALLDTVEELDTYGGDLVRLARTLYDARYQPTSSHRLTAIRELAAGLWNHPIRTVGRIARVIDLASVRKRNYKPMSRRANDVSPVRSAS